MLNIISGASHPFGTHQVRIPLFYHWTPFFNEVFFLFFFSGVQLLQFFVYTDIRSRIGKETLPICWWLFCLIESVFCLTEALQFYEVPFDDIYLTAQAIAVLFRIFSPVPISLRLFPTFSSISFTVFGIM